jgi:O-acetyl-ADP-ribose deacetylase (regulator of RNase III)
MRLHLVDSQSSVATALRRAFADHPEVDVECGDILALAHHALVSPANGHGFMDGGIDQQYAAFFGASLQRRVLDTVRARPEGYLPVGAAELVHTGHDRIPYLIVAPTMAHPEPVPAEHAYRALRAVLRLAAHDAVVAKDIYCPGLATLTGRVPPERAAAEMASAYADWRAAS